MIEMMDMGKKQDNPNMMGEEKGKIRINYPSFSINGDKIPEELADAKVGDMCRCEIIIKKIGDSIDTYGKGESRIEVEIHKLGYIGKSGKLSKEEYLSKSDDEKAKYDEEQVKADAQEDEAVDDSKPEDIEE